MTSVRIIHGDVGEKAIRAKYAVRTFKCHGCGLDVRARARPNATYCSLQCYRGSPRPNRRSGESVNCENCGRSVDRPPSARNRRTFCSVACHNDAQRLNRSWYSCKSCGVAFSWSPSRQSKNNPTYCSIRCRTACPDWRLNAAIRGNLVLQHSKKPTRLEIAGRTLLCELNVDFVEQQLVANRFVVDAFLPAVHVVVQWDGDYWHGYRSEGDSRPLDRRQSRRVALDKSQDALMSQMGIKVLRFWEHEVFGAPDDVKRAIRSALLERNVTVETAA